MSSARERAHGSQAEQPLGVRAGLGQHPSDGREAGSRDDDGETLLVDAVGSPDQRAELLGRDLVELVDQQGRAETLLTRALAERHEELRQVGLEVAGVGDPDFWLELEPEPAGDEAGLHGLGEARRDAPDPLGALLVAPTAVHGANHRRQGLGELRPQVASRAGLEQLDRPARRLGVLAERQQEDRLADTAEAVQDDRLERVAGRGAAR